MRAAAEGHPVNVAPAEGRRGGLGGQGELQQDRAGRIYHDEFGSLSAAPESDLRGRSDKEGNQSWKKWRSHDIKASFISGEG